MFDYNKVYRTLCPSKIKIRRYNPISKCFSIPVF